MENVTEPQQQDEKQFNQSQQSDPKLKDSQLYKGEFKPVNLAELDVPGSQPLVHANTEELMLELEVNSNELFDFD